MKDTKLSLLISFLVISLLSSLSPVSANMVQPDKTEVLISNAERQIREVSYLNKNNKRVHITPIPYSFDPRNQKIDDNPNLIFIEPKVNSFSVNPNESYTLNFEISPSSNLKAGTYFNIILLMQEEETPYIREDTLVGTMDSIAHLVVLHIADDTSSVLGITENFADIKLELTRKGIPYLLPTKVKYTLKNTSNYVLTPMGEIQIFNPNGKYPPSYIQLNEEEERLFQKETMEEEFTIPTTHLSDIMGKRRLVGRFYNGLDENFLLVSMDIGPNIEILGAILLLIATATYFLLSKRKRKSINKKSKPKKKIG